ncbi:hypothetical protein DFH09DRAFT_1162972 [Mycena vulgaris]|nr:hypothetical protein DFH09DRAFT_1162972 [Mycena vulgaris]
MQLLVDQPSERTPPSTVLHIVRDLRGDVLGEIDSPSPPAGLYPDVILQLAACLDDDHATSPYLFYDLWELVLSHWFPEREGYSIEPQWAIPYLEDHDGAADVTFAVLDANSPVLLLQISAPRDFHNDHTRATAEALSASQFEHVAPYCPLAQLCVITAMGKKWSAFHRSANLTAHEARELGEDRIDWMDDVMSEPSYEMMECFLSDVKEAVRAHRISGRQ